MIEQYQKFLKSSEKRQLTIADRLALSQYRFEDPRKDAIAEIADYLGKNEDEVDALLELGVLARKDWAKHDASSRESVEEFYSTTHGFIYDTMAAFLLYQKESTNLIINIVTLARSLQPQSVLDFGGGSGGYTICCKQLGMNISYADVAGETMNFAKWRFEKRGLDIPCLEARDWKSLGSFDLIYAFSVMEHLYDPVGTMAKIKEHLNPGGRIYLQNDFSPIEPMHLEKNLIYAKTFEQELRGLGFNVLHNYQNNGFMILAI